MQNDRMRRLGRLVAAPAVAVLVSVLVSGLLAGCSDDGDEPEAGSSSSPATPSATPYLPVPEGVTLTEPGSQLAVGDHAVVAYRPRQRQVGALDIQVTRLEETTIKESFSDWQLSGEQKRSTPYFVHARIENVGDTDLGGRPVPLYAVNDDNVLLESTPFASSFEACPSTPFPKKFGPGATTNACLVYLAPRHGELVAVSFRPEETFDPITWSGDIEKYVPPKPKKSKKGRGNA
jgi:hypothetical protein